MLGRKLGDGGEGQVWTAYEESRSAEPTFAVKIHFEEVGRGIVEPLADRMQEIRRVGRTVGGSEGLVFFEPPYQAPAPMTPSERSVRLADSRDGQSDQTSITEPGLV